FGGRTRSHIQRRASLVLRCLWGQDFLCRSDPGRKVPPQIHTIHVAHFGDRSLRWTRDPEDSFGKPSPSRNPPNLSLREPTELSFLGHRVRLYGPPLPPM